MTIRDMFHPPRAAQHHPAFTTHTAAAPSTHPAPCS
eukprot:CAMPEP_0113662788 /NCGR_PEP_ID=MMETSP0038_2-20120614/775_1 /TAXON_ID=2898 /ORGANISM="Cryptomonas paramecium" /LENGTH=35 /DNA_ID=CAMNT_0000577731 /DNA_START=668 /DNA_END=772 /DNA_ORIENTATION=+ /assembly_acc=CAM_ASM_000170